ncbi:MAG: hypothetical protein ABR536_03490 [Solirubrobacterales bacterium]
MATLVERLSKEDMTARAEKAEARMEKYRDRRDGLEKVGMAEEACEAERMRLECEATALYWRNRAGL